MESERERNDNRGKGEKWLELGGGKGCHLEFTCSSQIPIRLACNRVAWWQAMSVLFSIWGLQSSEHCVGDEDGESIKVN